MHIVLFNRSYYPDPEATGQYLTELAEDLVARGEEVSVVCGRRYHVSAHLPSALRRSRGSQGEPDGITLRGVGELLRPRAEGHRARHRRRQRRASGLMARLGAGRGA